MWHKGKAEILPELQKCTGGLVSITLVVAPFSMMTVVTLVVHDVDAQLEGKKTSIDQRLVVLMPISEGLRGAPMIQT